MNQEFSSDPTLYHIDKALEDSGGCAVLKQTLTERVAELKADFDLTLSPELYRHLKSTLHYLVLIRGTTVSLEQNLQEVKKDAYLVGQIELLQDLLKNATVSQN